MPSPNKHGSCCSLNDPSARHCALLPEGQKVSLQPARQGPCLALSTQSSKLRWSPGGQECFKAQPPAQDLAGLCSRAPHVPSRPHKDMCTGAPRGPVCLPPSGLLAWHTGLLRQSQPASRAGADGRVARVFLTPCNGEWSQQEGSGSFVEGAQHCPAALGMTGCWEPHHQGGNWGQGPSPGLTPKSQSDSRGHLECTLWAPDLVSETPRPSVYREHLVLTAGPGRLRVAWDRPA